MGFTAEDMEVDRLRRGREAPARSVQASPTQAGSSSALPQAPGTLSCSCQEGLYFLRTPPPHTGPLAE